MSAARATARPTVTVHGVDGKNVGTIAMPAVMTAPIRRDVVEYVHTNIAKNRRQAYAVSKSAGEQTSAESWGTGRAVARIPRVGGGGTHRSGQGAFGNMCRKGRMFAPTKIWRRWHRHVNVNQRRFAIVSALSASAVTAIVMARGHKVEKLPEVPLVVEGLSGVSKTKDAIKVLEAIGAADDVKRVEESRSVRAGKGKGRNRRFVSRRGPLLIVSEADGENVIKAFRNLPGVDVANVDRLNLLQLAPGGHVGRFCIWSKAAFERLGALYGSATVKSSAKSGYLLPRAQMHIADLGRLINSTEIQAVIRPAIKDRQWAKQKKNPLRNKKAMDKLNPYAAVIRKQEATAAEQRKAAKGKKVAQKRATKVQRAASKAFFRAVSSDEFVRPSEA